MTAGRSLRIVALAAGASLAGCAPVTFAPGSGMGVFTGPGLGMQLSSCPSLGLTSQAARMGITSASAQMGALRSQAAAIQNRYMFGAGPSRSDMSTWKKVATGEC